MTKHVINAPIKAAIDLFNLLVRIMTITKTKQLKIIITLIKINNHLKTFIIFEVI